MSNVEIKNHQINIKGLNVYYRTAGDSNNSPVILLNGWGARTTGFLLGSDKVIRELVRHRFYVYSPEHPGLMRSETPKEIWGFKEYDEYLEEFIQKLNIKNFILIGQSFGGAVATAYAAEHPSDIRVLVLVSAGLSSDKLHGFLFRHLLYGKCFSLTLRSKFVLKTVKKLFASAVLGIPWSHLEKENLENRATMGEIFSQWSLENMYKKVTTKTILIWGKYDQFFPISSARKVATELPNVRLYVVNAGHSVLYRNPKRTVELIVSAL